MKIDVKKVARKIEVDNSISLGYYYRIADNLLRQANIHREEKNIVDLYIILLRFSSLVLDTIPYHRDYQVLFPRERDTFKKRFLSVLNELEALKPEFERLVDELNKDYARTQLSSLDSGPSSSQSSAVNNLTYSSVNVKRPFGVSAQPSWKYDYNRSQVSSSNSPQLDKQLQKLSIGISLPKQETLSRHSFLGPNGLRSQWQGPTAQIKVQYPSYTELSTDENLIVKQAGNGSLAVKDSVSDTGGVGSTMESVLSLDDGRWSHPEQALTTALINEASADPFQFVGVRQPLPPPVLAHVQNNYSPIPPSQVADPRPGPAKPQDGIPSSNSYQHLHVPVSLMEDFLRLARSNTKKNLETCGVLAGSLKNKVFYITTLIIPKQEATSDSCSTLNEEEIFEVQDKMGLFPLGWIHTHPSQTCFMSSVDLHTHYSYQIMLPEAVAIVMAPTDTSSPHGIFHLSDPGGLSVIRNCDQRGFHPHEEALDGSSIYEHCSHVFMNSKCKFDVVDLR